MHPYLPHAAQIIERVQETPDIFTLRLRFTDPGVHAAYQFAPGQFNMLYLYGVGEVPISIVSDPYDEQLYDHTLRAVGQVTQGLAQLPSGGYLGVRGPYGRGWPLELARGRDVVLVTGGLGCAPLVSVINYIVRRRSEYRRLMIMQGVKHSADMFWADRYAQWSQLPNTQVLLAASQGGQGWPFATGQVTDLLASAQFDPAEAIAMLCGPEGMMHVAIDNLIQRGMPAANIYISMERNMQCAVKHCGHCQYGDKFVCRDGPVFAVPEVQALLGVRGF
jgi:sulfhydrogenase subunit gamma (sulfur reductase)